MYYFASDVHLGGGDPTTVLAREKLFVEWLEGCRKDAKIIFLVGDIFDFWFEYNHVVPRGMVRTLAKLAEITESGIRVLMFAGNHDMWMKGYLAQECGVEVIMQPITIELAGKRLFVAHGDNMNIKNKPLLRLMNWGFRSKVIISLFRWCVHPDLALKFGKWWSCNSRRRHTEVVDNTQILNQFASNYRLRNPDIDLFIFGHIHFARIYRHDNWNSLHLGGWDNGVSYATMDDNGAMALYPECK